MKPKPTLEEIVKELNRRFKRVTLEYNEALEDHGDDSREWLWVKCKRETLQEVLSLVDPGGEWDDGTM